MSHQLRYNARWQLRYANVLQGLIISLTFFAVVTSVIYSYYTSFAYYQTYGDGGQLGPDIHQVLIDLNLILPLAVTIFRGVYAYLNPMAKHTAFNYAGRGEEGRVGVRVMGCIEDVTS